MSVGLISAIVVLIVLSGMFSCSDMVYAAVNQLRLKKDARKSNASKLALKHAKNYDTTITTILFTNNLVNTGNIQGIPIVDHIIVSDSNFYSFWYIL